MSRAIRRPILGAFSVAALMLAISTSEGAGPLPATSYTAAIDADIAHLVALVERQKEDPANKSIPGRIKATAILIASHAQNGFTGRGVDRMASVRAAALKVAEACAAKDMDAAAKAVAALKNLAPDPNADKNAVALHKMHKIDLRDIMHLFGKAKGGGMNVEADIREMKKDGVTDVKLAELVGVRTVAIGEIAQNMPPTFTAKRTKEDWDRWMKEMNTLGIAFTEEASKGPKADLNKLKKTVSALDANCVNCHRVFRDP